MRFALLACSWAMLLILLTVTKALSYNTNGHRTVVFDPKHYTWTAYNANGDRVRSGRASGGKNYCPDIHRGCKTIVGTFSVISKGGPGCKSSKFPRPRGGAPMPYCMHFHPKGYAIHGSDDVPNANASHGCIRVIPTDAKWLSHHFVGIGTKVVVLPYR